MALQALLAAGALGIVVAVFYFLIQQAEHVETMARWGRTGVRELAAYARQGRTRRQVETTIDVGATLLQLDYRENFLEYGLAIEPKKVEEPQARLSTGDIAVVVRRSDSAAKSTATALMLYLKEALLTSVREHIEPVALRAVDLTFAKGTLNKAPNADAARREFYKTVRNPARADPELWRRLLQADRSDAQGFFLSILLREYRRLGARWDQLEPSDQFRDATASFMEWLWRHAIRPVGEPVTEPVSPGGIFRVALMYVGGHDRWKHLRTELLGYLKDKNIDVLYVTGWGDQALRVEALFEAIMREEVERRHRRLSADPTKTRFDRLPLRDLSMLLGLPDPPKGRGLARFEMLPETRNPGMPLPFVQVRPPDDNHRRVHRGRPWHARWPRRPGGGPFPDLRGS